jgi:hypothetical protein
MSKEILTRSFRMAASTGASLALAALAAIGPFAASRADAAQPVPEPKVLASSACHGTVTNSGADSEHLLQADFIENLMFQQTKNEVSPANPGSRGGTVSGVFVLSIQGTCPSISIPEVQNQTSCVQGGGFTGTISSGGLMTITFGEFTAAQLSGAQSPGPDVLDGCTETFQFNSFNSKKSAYAISEGSLTQSTATGAPTCKAAGAVLVTGCTTNNF